MLILASIIHLGKSTLPAKPISDDDVDWLSLCIRVLNDRYTVQQNNEHHYIKYIKYISTLCSTLH